MPKHYRDAGPASLHPMVRRFHIHVHAVVSDGVFTLKTVCVGRQELVFRPVPAPTAGQLAAITTAVRKKLIRCLSRNSGLTKEAAADLLSWKNSGFSINEEVYIKGQDRNGLERLLKYCSRPALSLARLIYSAKANTVIYRCDPRAGKPELLTLSPIKFLRRWTFISEKHLLILS